jgi:exosortase
MCVAVAYWFSLRSLAGGWNYETPLGDTVLVPFLALALGFAAARRHRYVAFVRLGRFDFALGLVLLGSALLLLAAGPVLWSKYFWAMRADLLTLPLVAAAGVLLLFGARALVPFVYPTLYLLFAWPLPYLALLERVLDAFTSTTTAAVGTVASTAHLATVIPSSEGTAFALGHGGHRFGVAVGSACSGIDSLVGYFLVSAFAVYFVRGSLGRRAALFLAGVALVWFFNVARIVLIFMAGRVAGERAAFAVLHPIAGLLALNAALFVLVRLGGRLELRWLGLEPARDDTPLAQPALPHQQAHSHRIVGRALVLATACVLLAVADGQLASAAQGYANDGSPAVRAFVRRPAVGPGWHAHRIERIPWASQYYGPHSTWIRYRLRPARTNNTQFTVWLDAVQSPDLGALDAYSLAHCYGFHHFDVELDRRVDLGKGVVGQAFAYTTSRGLWHVVSWQWPVLGKHGDVTHERIVLIASTGSRPNTAAPPAAHGFQGFVLSLLDLPARSHDDNPALTRALTNLAARAVATRIAPKA